MLNLFTVMLPTEFLRGVLGLLGLGCAYMSGRSLASVRQGAIKPARHFAWLIRTLLCLAALAFRHTVDTVAIVIWSLAAATFAAGFWQAGHQKPQADIAKELFPPEN
jgi:hypothetical protein